MGNQIICSNLYCSPLLPKPDWFSHQTWSITNKENHTNQLSVDKGIITIKNVLEENIFLIQKEIRIDDNFDIFTVPLNILINKPLNIRVEIILSANPLTFDNININNIFKGVIISKNNYIYFYHDYEPIKSKYKLKNKKYYIEYIFDNQEYDDKIMLKNSVYIKNKNIINNNHTFDKNKFTNNFYINIIIKISGMVDNNYINLQIE